MKKIYLSPPHLSGHEIKYVSKAIDSNWIAPVGPFLKKFENKISNFLKVKHSLCVSSGTAAIHLAMRALKIKKGDIILCQNFTFIGSVTPILYCNAIPVFIGSEKESWNICPIILRDTIIKYIKKGKIPKAILVVHLYGMPAKIKEIMKISKEFNIPVIEDAAEALGSSINGKKCGSFGDLGILSFNGNKIMTTSGGGALVSNNKKYINYARYLSTQARDNYIHYQHSDIGYNYRMSNLLASFGYAQMLTINDRVKTRRTNYNDYKLLLKKFNSIKFFEENQSYKTKIFSNRWLTTIVLGDEIKVSINKIVKLMMKKNIEVRPFWKPMNLQPVLKKYKYYGNAFEIKLFKKGLCLPSGSNLSIKERKLIIKQLLNILINEK